jgi:hypothetical protein
VTGALLPHVLAAVEAAERLGVGLEAAATVLNETAVYHHARAAWTEAEPRLSRRAIAFDEKVHGPGHPEAATDLGDLAPLYRIIGRHAAAEPLHERSIAIGERRPSASARALGHHPFGP